MDPTAVAAEPAGLVGWVMANGQILLFFAQLIFWIVVGAASLWAAATFHRYTKFMMGGSVAVAKTEEKAVSVEEFVE